MTGTPQVDPLAAIHPSAQLGADVVIGPFCTIGPEVTLGDRCRLESHVVIQGPAVLGPDNVVSPMAVLGGPAQDLRYRGEPTKLIVGARNRIREGVTLHRGTEHGGGVTRVGDDNFLMAYAHVGHDCQVGSRTVFVNGATLAGHVEVGDDATVGAFSGVHQFCRVARFAFIGGYSVVTRDALPWVLTVGNRARAAGLNVVGLRRLGYAAETIAALKRCYLLLLRSKLTLAEGVARAEAELGHVPEVQYFLGFVRQSERGVCR